jgi:hypothetical protein
MALGAGRACLLRQGLTQALLIALVGGALGARKRESTAMPAFCTPKPAVRL